MTLDQAHSPSVKGLDGLENLLGNPILKLGLDPLEIEPLSPVAEVRGNDEESPIVKEQFLQGLGIFGHLGSLDLANHEGDQFEVFFLIQEDLVNEGQVQLEAMFILIVLFRQSDEEALGFWVLHDLVQGCMVDVYVTEWGLPLRALGHGEGVESKAVTGSQKHDPVIKLGLNVLVGPCSRGT
eukprot:CAMPEP_0168625298 /NCGR_PEP_ID=MMETSP0449_2-20121227/9920_1 /TAXON_ID=1082188 /ORGANISM="Strombidium rassoulzadegani, Strain ras09" /LENGTH=181 /DNA_ID=CAMNT_0008667009 /DNA_START=206 /DNA_END=751 /DNA_ORIENTATION=+